MMLLSSRIRFLLGLLFASVWTLSTLPSAVAHDGPTHVIDSLTRQMRLHGATSELLYRRAIEYRSLGDRTYFARDLDAAIAQDATFVPARLELAKHKVQTNELAAARSLIEPLIKTSDRTLRAVALATRAEIDAREHDWEQAVDALTLALTIRPEVEWYLRRAEFQHQSQRPMELIAGLRDGYEKTESPLLLRSLCDHLIDLCISESKHKDLSDFSEAMAIVEQELEESRIRSGWLIRRARIRSAQGESNAARDDLSSAIHELQTRISEYQPDPELVSELATANSMLQSLTN